MRSPPDRLHDKAARALELHEQGVGRSAIAERLGIVPNQVHGYIQRGRQRREKAKETAE